MTCEGAVCYVTDINFLLPSIVSAVGVRKYVPADRVDVFIFLIDQEGRVSDLNHALSPYKIQIISMNSQSYSGVDNNRFNQTGISMATLGRFFIEPLLPATTKRIVYIDGDTWIHRDPSVLVDVVVPDGRFAAVDDSCVMPLHNPSIKAYLKTLRVNWKKNGYFNAGVFAVSRQTWRTVSEEAFKFLLNHTESCKLHDQSALNAVVGDRRIRLSTRWNFQTSYKYLNVANRVKPCIYHFTQYPKPWMGECEPWKEVYSHYQEAVQPFSGLGLPLRTVDKDTVEKHNRLNFKKRLLLKSPALSHLFSILIGFEKMESQTWLRDGQ